MFSEKSELPISHVFWRNFNDFSKDIENVTQEIFLHFIRCLWHGTSSFTEKVAWSESCILEKVLSDIHILWKKKRKSVLSWVTIVQYDTLKQRNESLYDLDLKTWWQWNMFCLQSQNKILKWCTNAQADRLKPNQSYVLSIKQYWNEVKRMKLQGLGSVLECHFSWNTWW